MRHLVRVADGSNEARHARKASGPVAVMAVISDRLFHKGNVRGKKKYLYVLAFVAMWRNL